MGAFKYGILVHQLFHLYFPSRLLIILKIENPGAAEAVVLTLLYGSEGATPEAQAPLARLNLTVTELWTEENSQQSGADGR